MISDQPCFDFCEATFFINCTADCHVGFVPSWIPAKHKTVVIDTGFGSTTFFRPRFCQNRFVAKVFVTNPVPVGHKTRWFWMHRFCEEKSPHKSISQTNISQQTHFQNWRQYCKGRGCPSQNFTFPNEALHKSCRFKVGPFTNCTVRKKSSRKCCCCQRCPSQNFTLVNSDQPMQIGMASAHRNTNLQTELCTDSRAGHDDGKYFRQHAQHLSKELVTFTSLNSDVVSSQNFISAFTFYSKKI